MEPTKRFQQALPYLLLPVSVPLSALHAPSCPRDAGLCPSCGVCLFIGTSHSRIARSKSKKARVLQITCLACDHVQTTPLELYSPNTPRIPSVEPDNGDTISSNVISTQRPRQALHEARKDSPRDSVAPPSNPQTSRSGAAGGNLVSQSRPKKKMGLQAMLARNREQEKAQEKAKNQATQQGLSAFLGGL